MKKALPLTLILIGATFLIAAIVFWIDSATSPEPPAFGETLLKWLSAIVGLGASLKGWMDLARKEKPEKPALPTTKIDVKGGNPQISIGDNSRNIQTQTYIENQTVQHTQESKTPKSLNQLPSPPLDFIRRKQELAQLHKNIEKGVVISGVQGMGGIGKTTLVLKLAEEIAPNYPDGQIYLDLFGAPEQTPLTPEQIMAHVIRSFHPETALPLDYRELGAMYRSVLSGKKVLLFYDNARDENQLLSLLPPKNCVLFVTSRQFFTLPGLDAINLGTLTLTESVELVQKIAPSVVYSDAETLASQCGYLPLAIRVAVSILLLRPDWHTSDLIERLKDNRTRLGLVENSLNLSYDSLDDNLKRYLCQLGIFSLPFTERDMSDLFGIENNLSIDAIISQLLRTSWLNYDKKTRKYYFHDMTALFLIKRFIKDGKSIEILTHYMFSYSDSIRKFIEMLIKCESEVKSIIAADKIDISSAGDMQSSMVFLWNEFVNIVQKENIGLLVKEFCSENSMEMPSIYISYDVLQKMIAEEREPVRDTLYALNMILHCVFYPHYMPKTFSLSPEGIDACLYFSSIVYTGFFERVKFFREKYLTYSNHLFFDDRNSSIS